MPDYIRAELMCGPVDGRALIVEVPPPSRLRVPIREASDSEMRIVEYHRHVFVDARHIVHVDRDDLQAASAQGHVNEYLAEVLGHAVPVRYWYGMQRPYLILRRKRPREGKERSE